MLVDTIPARLFQQARLRPNAPAYSVRRGTTWQSTTWRAYADNVSAASRALIALGLEPGDSVCILGFNRPEWVIFDIAAMAAGGVPAGIYTTCSPEEVQYIIHHSEAKVVLLEDAGQWAKVDEKRNELPKLEHVVMMQGAPAIDDPLVMSWDDFIARGTDTPTDTLDERLANLKEEDLATLIYTSGTTGPPKGVMLSHGNLSWTAMVSVEVASARANDVLLSYLPLSHIAEQMFTVHGAITSGYMVCYAESIERVPDNLKEVRPTIMFGVPRIWEKFQAGILNKVKDAPPARQKIFHWALSIGKQVSHYRSREEVTPLPLELQYRLANKLVISKLKAALGLDRTRFRMTGAAPISEGVMDFFKALDLEVLEVYGQSEDCGPTSCTRYGAVKANTVGRPIPGVRVRIAEDDEILVKGPNVFMGYFKDEDATADTLIDGWLHSGDLGAFDSDGYLTITGRKKDIIITSGGKNITPKNIELGLKDHPLVAEAVVIGDRRKYLTALLVMDDEAAAKLAAETGSGSHDLHSNDNIRSAIQAHVDTVNSRFARVEQIKRFTILPRPFSVEEGELTPSLKVKRRVVNEHFADEIESMYS